MDFLTYKTLKNSNEYIIKQKTPKRVFFVHISRILSDYKVWMIIYLGQLLPAGSCGSLSPDFGLKFRPKSGESTALHASKDLAVSPYMLPYKLFLKKILRNSFTFDPDVSARTSMIAHDGRYPLRFSCLALTRQR